MLIEQTMPETIACAVEAVRAAEPVAAADPLRPVFHFRPTAVRGANVFVSDDGGKTWEPQSVAFPHVNGIPPGDCA
jgi:hypothetical protein